MRTAIIRCRFPVNTRRCKPRPPQIQVSGELRLARPKRRPCLVCGRRFAFRGAPRPGRAHDARARRFSFHGFAASLGQMTTPDARARFLEKLEAGWRAGTFIKLTLSEYRGAEEGLRNGYGRAVELKE